MGRRVGSTDDLAEKETVSASQKRLGLLGGTFDPPHLGHLWLAETAWEQLQLDRVIFLPSGQPPHKRRNPVSAVTYRLKMLQLAIAGNPHFTLDTIDIERKPPHTTHSLLPLLQRAYPNTELWLLMGTDSLRDLPTWKRPGQIVAQCRLAALPRPGVVIDWQAVETSVPGIKKAVDILNGPTLDISSTEIRRWARTGRTLRYLLPTAVLNYVIETDLYH